MIYCALGVLLSHKPSPVKTAKNSTTDYFDCHLQTNQNDAVRLVCYSLRKRTNLQQVYEKRSPIKITETKRNTAKRTTADKEEYTIIKAKKVTPATLEFPSDESCVSNLLTVVDAFNANVYQSVDLKVKLVTKSENEQVVKHNDKIKYKVDSILGKHIQKINHRQKLPLETSQSTVTNL